MGKAKYFLRPAKEWDGILPHPEPVHSRVTTAVCRDPQLALTASEPMGRSSRAGKGWMAMKGQEPQHQS